MFEVPKTMEILEELPQRFISLITTEVGQEYVMVTQQMENIELLLPSKTKRTLSRWEFLEEWTGIVAVVEETTGDGREEGQK